jgi:hypothetical protein
MLEFIAGIYQHREPEGVYLKQTGGLQFREDQINSASIIQLAQTQTVELFKYTAGAPELDETIERSKLPNDVAMGLLSQLANNQIEIHKAFTSADYITLVFKVNK